MRYFAALLTVLAGLGSAQATTFYVDLNTIGTVGQVVGPCYCGSGPLFDYWSLPSTAKAGDIVDFGTVKIYSVLDGHTFGRLPYEQIQFYIDQGILEEVEKQYNYQAFPVVSYTPVDYLSWSGDTGSDLGSSVTIALLFEVFDGERGIQIGWGGPSNYTASAPQVQAVPEAATWAMMLLGFAALQAMRLSKRRWSHRTAP